VTVLIEDIHNLRALPEASQCNAIIDIVSNNSEKSSTSTEPCGKNIEYLFY